MKQILVTFLILSISCSYSPVDKIISVVWFKTEPVAQAELPLGPDSSEQVLPHLS